MLSFVWLWLPNLYHLRISDQFRNSFLFQSFCSNHDLGILRVRYFHTVLQMCYSVVNNYLSTGRNRFDLESGPWTVRATCGKETLYQVPIKFAH